MKLVVTLASLLLLATSSVDAQDTIAITRRVTPTASAQLPAREPRASAGSSNFTGSVRVSPVFQSIAPGRATGSDVTFEPGARTAWHTHPGGQTLIVSAGVGRVQQWGAPAHEIRPGDVVRIPPNVKHWHGASPDSVMTHLAIVESIEGRSVEWMEPVADAHYRAPVRARPPAASPGSARVP